MDEKRSLFSEHVLTFTHCFVGGLAFIAALGAAMFAADAISPACKHAKRRTDG